MLWENHVVSFSSSFFVSLDCGQAASSMGKFSTDRCMREYAKDIWMIDSYERPPPDEFQRMRSFANDNTNKVSGTVSSCLHTTREKLCRAFAPGVDEK